MSRENKTTIAGISIGDVNGIGPEVIIKTFSDQRILDSITPVIYASNKVLSYYKKLLNAENFHFTSIRSSNEIKEKKINLVNLWNEDIEFNVGRATPEGGKYAYKSLEAVTADLASNKLDILITGPIDKDSIQNAGFNFPGHTEYLAKLSNVHEALMMMVSENLRVALATTHVAIKDVSGSLTKELLIDKIKVMFQSLKKDFGINKPKIAVLGLNPHAGEKGKMGDEEKEIISPAIHLMQKEQMLVYGPYPADSFFGSSNVKNFDGILAMYHDQGLAPFKAVAFDAGVNFTAGLPIVRTSPDHGTAFDIAGKNKASETSFRNAVFLAADIYKNRVFEREISANPLKTGSLEIEENESN